MCQPPINQVRYQPLDFSSSSSIEANAAQTRLKRRGERGSPYRSPLNVLKYSLGFPLILMPTLPLSIICFICRVGLGSGWITLGFGSKNISPCPAHDMVGSGRVRVGSGWPAILCLIFWLYQIFFEFWVKYSGPYPTCHLVGSGRVFFERVGSG